MAYTQLVSIDKNLLIFKLKDIKIFFCILLSIYSIAVQAAELTKFSNGDIFYGEIINGNKQGKGSFVFKNGDQNIGDYINDRCDGFFLYTKKNGEQFYQVCSSSGISNLVNVSFKTFPKMPKNPKQSKWYLTGMSNKAIDLIDITSIRMQGNVSTFWSLINFKESSDSPTRNALSILSKMQADCNNDSMRALYSYWYPMRDGEGAYIHEENHEALKAGDSLWKPVPPTSDAIYQLEKACGR